jgi:hypothetical protein
MDFHDFFFKQHMAKNFLLGVGCQKGGTTWLHSQLEGSKNADMGFCKEYHVFDALHVPECRSFLNNKLKILHNASRDIRELSKKKEVLQQLSFYTDTQYYYDYFDYLWFKGRGAITAVGDITPSYSALPAAVFSEIKTQLELRGFKVKVIFLMRDPIERCWSMVRMDKRKGLHSNPGGTVPDEQKLLKKIFMTRDCEIRTQYERTIDNLEQVFEQENIFYGFYESLFEAETLASIQAFIELEDFSPNTTHKLNVSAKSDDLTELDTELASQIFHHYQNTYHFCEARFGTKHLWTGWKYA